MLNLPKDEARVELIPDSLFGSLLGESPWGANWWQIRLVEGRRSIRCARERSKSKIQPRDEKMADDEWIKTLENGRKVKFFYQELLENRAFITAQIEGNEVIYSIILTKARNPMSREDVESHFKGELSKKCTV
jgi:hypothetical protein